MAETRDRWAKAEVIIGAVSALGSIAIPVALFVVGNGLAERQRLASDKQVEDSLAVASASPVSSPSRSEARKGAAARRSA